MLEAMRANKSALKLNPSLRAHQTIRRDRGVTRDSSRRVIGLVGSRLRYDIKFDGTRCFLMASGMDEGMGR